MQMKYSMSQGASAQCVSLVPKSPPPFLSSVHNGRLKQTTRFKKKILLLGLIYSPPLYFHV